MGFAVVIGASLCVAQPVTPNPAATNSAINNLDMLFPSGSSTVSETLSKAKHAKTALSPLEGPQHRRLDPRARSVKRAFSLCVERYARYPNHVCTIGHIT